MEVVRTLLEKHHPNYRDWPDSFRDVMVIMFAEILSQQDPRTLH